MTQTTLDLSSTDGGHAAVSAAPIAADPQPPAAEWQTALAMARAAQAAADGHAGGRSAAAWWRQVLLRSFVTPLAHADAALLPLRVLPPPGLQPVNPVQALQAAITLALARPGGVAQVQRLAAALPAAPPARRRAARPAPQLAARALGSAAERSAVRAADPNAAPGAARPQLALHRFVSALLPRLIEHAAQAAVLPAAVLEAAWLDARVNRCWQAFALAIDEPMAAQLAAQLAARLRARGRQRARSGDNRRRAAAPARRPAAAH